jgi:hypothetical protein
MIFPRKVVVRGYSQDIDYVATSREVEQDFANDDFVGQVCQSDPGAGKIRIKATREPIRVLDTLVHEILHCIFQRNPLLTASVRPEIGEEAFIDTLGCELAYLLVSNQWITLPDEVPVTTTRIL